MDTYDLCKLIRQTILNRAAAEKARTTQQRKGDEK